MRPIPRELADISIFDDNTEAETVLRRELQRTSPRTSAALVGIVAAGHGILARSLSTGRLILYLETDKWFVLEPEGFRRLI